MSDLRDGVAAFSPEQRKFLAQRQEKSARETASRGIPRRTATGPVPLSFGQQRLWFLDQLQPGKGAYNMSTALRLEGPLVVPALEKSIGEIIRRHESLRTVFSSMAHTPVQVVSRSTVFSLPFKDLSGLPTERKNAEAQRLVDEEASSPFDLEHGPLFRAKILRMETNVHVLMVTMHHIISDGWSMGLFWNEIETIYEAFSHQRPSPLPELKVQYPDFARWQRQWLQGSALEEQLDYWRKELSGALPLLELPADYPPPTVQTFRGARHILRLSKELSTALKELGKQHGATLFMTMMAAFKSLLHRYSALEDIIVGTPIAGRNRIEIENMIGFFVNTLVLRTNLSGNPSFRELLGRVRQKALDAFAHQDLPFEKLVEELHPDRSLKRTPFFQVFFNMGNIPKAEIKLSGLTVEHVSRSDVESKFDLTLYVTDREDGMQLKFVYNADLFSGETMARMAGYFHCLLQHVVAEPDAPLSRLLIRTEEKARELFSQTNQVRPTNDFREFKKEEIEQSISRRFEEQARNFPQNVAVRTRNHTWTYKQLNQSSNRVAHTLLSRVEAKTEERVALLMEHDAPMIAGILGVLKAGKTYVPLDSSYPKDRLAWMSNDSQAAVVIATNQTLTLAHELSRDGLTILNLDEIDRQAAVTNPDISVPPDRPAYILYTSGSTGQPKGVVQNHRNVLHHIRVYTNSLHIHSNDRLTLLASYGFDAAVMDLFGALLNGASLFPVNVRAEELPAIAHWINQNHITIYHSTPTLFRYLTRALSADAVLRSVRMVVMGGEEGYAQDVEAYQRHFSEACIFVNGFGPTESTLALQNFIGHETKLARDRVPVGYPVDETDVVLLNDNGEETAVSGEITIQSRHVAIGYWQRPDLTRDVFLTEAELPERRVFRTGDLGRLLPDGRIEFLGRKDFQVKVRGFRIETGEIEAALGTHPSIRQSAVVAFQNGADEKHLVAYVVPNDVDLPESPVLRSFLHQKLPDYMVPFQFVVLKSLPLTPNGKVDRRALPPPKTEEVRWKTEFVAPRNQVEQRVADILAEVLGVNRIGIHDDFFDLGGHSLLGIQLLSKLGDAFEVKLPVRSLFESPTVAGLAARIETLRKGTGPGTGGEQNRWSFLVPIQAEGPNAPLFLIPGGAGGEDEFIVYARMARFVGDDFPFYGLQARGCDGQREPHAHVKKMATDYVKEIRSFQPEGPYHLAGECIGGIVAYEMARQLMAQGQKVALLMLLDTPRPTTARYIRHYVVTSSRAVKTYWRDNFDFADRLAFHWEKLRQMQPRERPRYFLDKALKSVLVVAHALHLKRIPDPKGKQEVVQRAQRVRTGYQRSLLRYKPKPYAGRVTLLTNESWYRHDPTGGWADLALGGIDLVRVPGNHRSYIRADAKTTAMHLRACLEKATRNGN